MGRRRKRRRSGGWKKWLWIGLALLVLGGIATNLDLDDWDDATTGPANTGRGQDFGADLKLQMEGDVLVATVTSNAPDGAVFLIAVDPPDLYEQTALTTLVGGKGSAYFKTDQSWGVGVLEAGAYLFFTNPEIQQPGVVTEVYGLRGEHLTGKNIVASGDMKFGQTPLVTLLFPSESEVNAVRMAALYRDVDAFIAVYDGAILSIGPRFTRGDWEFVNVVVPDGWYRLQGFEKERLAGNIIPAVERLLTSHGIDRPSVTIVDRYGKDLATKKMFGGYDIKG